MAALAVGGLASYRRAICRLRASVKEPGIGTVLDGLDLTGGQNGYIVIGVYLSRGAMQVAKWGNSLAIRLPAAVVEALQLKEDDDIELHVVDARAWGVARKPSREQLLERLRAFRGKLPADFRFDRDEANAR